MAFLEANLKKALLFAMCWHPDLGDDLIVEDCFLRRRDLDKIPCFDSTFRCGDGCA